MSRYVATVHTPAALLTVWEALTDFSTIAQWDPGVVEAERLDSGPVVEGSRFRVVTRTAGREVPLTYEVVEIDPPRRIRLVAETSTFRSDDTMTFRTVGRETEVTYDARLEPKGVARLGAPLFGLALRRIGHKAEAGLAEHVRRLPAPDPR